MVDRNRNRRTMWHDVIAWGKLADWMNKWLDKGSQILVEGYLESFPTTVKGTDIKYWKVQVRAKSIVFMMRPPKPMKDEELEAPADESLPDDLPYGVPADPIDANPFLDEGEK